MNEINVFNEYLTTGKIGAYHQESAVLKKAENGAVCAVYRDSEYKIDDESHTRERLMVIKGKQFIISSVFPADAKATATDKMLELIDADMKKK